MNVKKFSILTAVVVGVMLIITIVLGCVPINVPVSPTPDQIVVYNMTSTGITYDKDQRPSKYEKLCKLYKNTTKLSIFDYMLKGQAVTKMPSQDINNTLGNWTDDNKKNYVCIEVIFKETQNVVVEIDGDTKAIKFTSLIMKVEKTFSCHQVAVYFSTSTGSYHSYQTSPILIYAKQNKLFKYIRTLNDSAE